MPQGQVVGRISVRVLPDTSDFRATAQRELDRIEKQLSAKIKITAELDGSEVVAEAKQVQADAERALRDLHIRVDLDNEQSLHRAINRISSALSDLNATDFKIKPNADELSAALDQFRQQLDDIATVHLRVDEGSLSSLGRAVARIDAELERLREIDLDVELNEESLLAAREALVQQMEDITPEVKLDLRVNEGSLGSVQRAIGKIDAELDKLGEIELNINLDEGSLLAARENLVRQMEELTPEVKVDLQIDHGSLASMKRAMAKIDAELDKLREVELHISLDEASLTAAKNVLAWEIEAMEPQVQIDLRINSKSISSMERAIAKIDGELQKLEEVELRVDVDPVKLREMRDLLTRTIETERRVKVAMDTAHANALQEGIQRALDRIKISPTVDAQAAAKAKRDIESILDRISGLRATITPEMDDQARRRVERQIDDLKDKVDKIKSEVQPETSKGAVASVMAALARLTRDRVINLFPRVSLSAMAAAQSMLAALSGGRVLVEMFDNLGTVLRNLDKSVPIIGTLALAIAGLAGWALSAASNLFALSSSLAQIGPAALLLPGLLGGMAVGVGVMVAAFRDFNTILPEVKGQLSGLQDAISANFWAKAAAPIRAMVDQLLPEFTAGVKVTATQLGGFFGGLATGLKGALDPALSQMFRDLSDSITVATGGTGAFASIIAVLGKVGTSYLPELAKWFVGISTRFDHFLTTAEADGRLKSWIDTAIQNLKDLGSVLSNLGGILAGISRAATAAGGSTLGSLADTLERIHRAVDSPAFQSGLTDVFAAAHRAMSNIAEQSGPAVKQLFTTLGQLLSDVLPQVGAILGTALSAIASALSQPAVVDGVKSLFSGIQTAVNALAPAMAPLGQALGTLLGLAGSFATFFGPVVSAALVPLAAAFQAIVPSVTPLIGLLSGALLTAIQQLTPVVLGLVPVIQGLLATAFQTLATLLPPVAAVLGQLLAAVAPIVEQLVNALAPILPILASALGTLLSALMPIVSIVLQIAMAILGPVLEALSKVLAEILPKLSEALSRVVKALEPFLSALLAIVQFLMPILIPVLTFLVGILADSLINAINGVALVLEGLQEIFIGVWNYIKGWFELWWGLFEGIFTGNWDTFKQGFSDLWDGILGILKGIWDVILGALEFFLNIGILGLAKKGFTFIKLAFTEGWSLVKGVSIELWDSLVARFGSFMSTLKDTPRAAMTAMKDFFRGIWDDIGSWASSAWSGIKTTVSDAIVDLVVFVQSLPGKIMAVFVGAGDWLIDIGNKLIQGLIDGIKRKFEDVKKTLKNLTDMLPDWKGPESLDRVLLTDAGKAVIDGFIRGLESRYDAVRDSLKGLTGDVAGTEFGAPSIDQINAARRAASRNARVASGLSTEGGVTKVLNYYAAPGSSLGSEEDLFAAIDRGRAAGW